MLVLTLYIRLIFFVYSFHYLSTTLISVDAVGDFLPSDLRHLLVSPRMRSNQIKKRTFLGHGSVLHATAVQYKTTWFEQTHYHYFTFLGDGSSGLQS